MHDQIAGQAQTKLPVVVRITVDEAVYAAFDTTAKSKSCLCTSYFTRNKLEPSSMHRQRAFLKVVRSADTAFSEASIINPFCCN